jgi:hypothetical protein
VLLVSDSKLLTVDSIDERPVTLFGSMHSLRVGPAVMSPPEDVTGVDGVVVVVVGGAVVVVVVEPPPPPPPPPPEGAVAPPPDEGAVETVDVTDSDDTGRSWLRSRPNSRLRLDSAAETYKCVAGPAIAALGPPDEADASTAIMPTSMAEDMASAATFGKRCAVSPLTN